MEYLNLIAMKEMISKLILALCFCGGLFGVLLGTSVLFEKIWKFISKIERGRISPPHRK